MKHVRCILAAFCLILTSCFAEDKSPQVTMTENDIKSLSQFEGNLRAYFKTHEVRFENQILNEALLAELKGSWILLPENGKNAGKSFSKGRWTVTVREDRTEGRFAIRADMERGAFSDYEIWLRNIPEVEVLKEDISMN